MYNVVKESIAGKDVANIGNTVNIGQVQPDVSRKCGTKLSGSRLTYKAGKGFTLIELLVVVLIIGILAAVALPQYQKAVEKSRYAEAAQTVANLEKAIDLWILENRIPDKNVTFLNDDPAFLTSYDVFAELPIDVVDCISYDEVGSCNLKNFNVTSSCSGNANNVCEITLKRLNTYYPILYSARDPQTGIWARTCGYDDALGKAACEYLESQGGWVAVEGWEI